LVNVQKTDTHLMASFPGWPAYCYSCNCCW